MCVFDESGQKSCRIVYFPTCLVLVILLGIVEVWGFLLFAKAFCRYSRKWRCLRLMNVKHPPLYLKAKVLFIQLRSVRVCIKFYLDNFC